MNKQATQTHSDSATGRTPAPGMNPAAFCNETSVAQSIITEPKSLNKTLCPLDFYHSIPSEDVVFTSNTAQEHKCAQT